MPDAPDSQYSQLERARRRRSAIAFAMWMAFAFVLFALLSRVGLLARLPWLRTEAPGAITTPWLGVLIVKSAAGALVAGMIWYRVVRFPRLRDTSSPG